MEAFKALGGFVTGWVVIVGSGIAAAWLAVKTDLGEVGAFVLWLGIMAIVGSAMKGRGKSD